jgi:hypothetical protein
MWQSMSKGGESINENINQSSEETPSRVTEMEEEGIEETATEEQLEEQDEQSETSAFEQPSSQLEVEAKPKAKTVDKIRKSLVDTSNQILKQMKLQLANPF